MLHFVANYQSVLSADQLGVCTVRAPSSALVLVCHWCSYIFYFKI